MQAEKYDSRCKLRREHRRRLRLEARVIALKCFSGHLLSEHTDAQRANWSDIDRAVFATPPRASGTSDSDSRSETQDCEAATSGNSSLSLRRPVVRNAVSTTSIDHMHSPPDQEICDALCQHHGYLLGGGGRPYPLSDDAVAQEEQWARGAGSGANRSPTAVPPAVPP